VPVWPWAGRRRRFWRVVSPALSAASAWTRSAKARKLIVLRQFHVEGFVNTYRRVDSEGGANSLVFESEVFENFSNSWKARETYEFLSTMSSLKSLSWRHLASRFSSTAAISSNEFKGDAQPFAAADVQKAGASCPRLSSNVGRHEQVHHR
jgi:hypothetical protein